MEAYKSSIRMGFIGMKPQITQWGSDITMHAHNSKFGSFSSFIIKMNSSVYFFVEHLSCYGYHRLSTVVYLLITLLGRRGLILLIRLTKGVLGVLSL